MRCLFCSLLVAGTLLATGCWDRTEVVDLAIVDVIGIDKAPDGVRVAIDLVIPGQAQAPPGTPRPRDRAEELYADTGRTLTDAMFKIQLQVPRRLFWSHARILIIGEEYAREGIRPVLDFWSRHREPRLGLLVVVTPGQATDVLQHRPTLERLLSESLRETLNLRLQVRTSLLDVLLRLRSPGEHPVAPRLELVPGVNGEADVKITGTAIFREDRLIGWLDVHETRGLLWLRDEITTGAVTVKLPGSSDLSVQLVRARTTVHPELVDDRLRMAVLIEAEHDVYETAASIDLDKEETIEILQQLLQKELREQIRPVLDKVQHQFRVDVLKFGDAVRRGAFLLWEGGLKRRWDQEFPRVPVDLSVTAHIRRVGQHGAPVGARKEQIKEAQGQLVEGKE